MLPRRLRVEGLETRRLFAVVAGSTDTSSCPAEHAATTAEVSVAIAAENLSGVRAAEFQFRYEASELDVDRSDVKLGAAWQGKASVVTKVNERSGTIHVFVYSAKPISVPSGELLEFDVEVLDTLAHDVASRIELTRFELNEGQIQATPQMLYEPIQPAFPSLQSPEITSAKKAQATPLPTPPLANLERPAWQHAATTRASIAPGFRPEPAFQRWPASSWK